jgi:hypothetical protein
MDFWHIMMAGAESVSFRMVFGLVSYVVFDHDDEDDDVDGDLGFVFKPCGTYHTLGKSDLTTW